MNVRIPRCAPPPSSLFLIGEPLAVTKEYVADVLTDDDGNQFVRMRYQLGREEWYSVVLDTSSSTS